MSVRGERLTDEGLQRVARLASKVRLMHTPREYPHVINRIAALWNHPKLVIAYFDELILDQKGRAGFPFSVANELTDFRSYYESRYCPTRPGWQDAVPHRDTTGRAMRLRGGPTGR